MKSASEEDEDADEFGGHKKELKEKTLYRKVMVAVVVVTDPFATLFIAQY